MTAYATVTKSGAPSATLQTFPRSATLMQVRHHVASPTLGNGCFEVRPFSPFIEETHGCGKLAVAEQLQSQLSFADRPPTS